MRRVLTEILVLVTASTVIALCAAVVGAKLTAPTPSAPVPADLLSGTCLDEPFLAAPAPAVVVGSLARLCFDVDAVRPRIELTGLPSGVLFTAWLSHAPRPAVTPREPCDAADSGPNGAVPLPARFDAAVADQTGRVQLTATIPGLRIVGGSQPRLFVVEHGWIGPDRAAVRPDDVLVWDRAWVHGAATTSSDRHGRGRLVGCASFWLRGGVETLEN